jgi:hypothetical protein
MSKNKAYHERRRAKKQAKREAHGDNKLWHAKQLVLIMIKPEIDQAVYSMTKEKQVKHTFESYYIKLAVESGANTKDREALIEIGQTIERGAA